MFNRNKTFTTRKDIYMFWIIIWFLTKIAQAINKSFFRLSTSPQNDWQSIRLFYIDQGLILKNCVQQTKLEKNVLPINCYQIDKFILKGKVNITRGYLIIYFEKLSLFLLPCYWYNRLWQFKHFFFKISCNIISIAI